MLLQCNMAMVAIARRRIFTVVTREKETEKVKKTGKECTTHGQKLCQVTNFQEFDQLKKTLIQKAATEPREETRIKRRQGEGVIL